MTFHFPQRMPSQASHVFFFLFVSFGVSMATSAQETLEKEGDIPVAIVETLPAWGSCSLDDAGTQEDVRTCTEQAISKYVVSNLTYPQKARRKGIEGRVIVKFIVEKDGAVAEVTVVKGVHPMLDDEAQRVVESMPDFQPGMQRGKPVRVSYHLPFNFSLN